MSSLNCEHLFCAECVKEHVTQAITSGKAVSIKCMQDKCPERYLKDDVEPHVTSDQLKVYENVN